MHECARPGSGPGGVPALRIGCTVTGRSTGVRRAAMLSDSAAIRWQAYTAAAAAAACTCSDPAPRPHVDDYKADLLRACV